MGLQVSQFAALPTADRHHDHDVGLIAGWGKYPIVVARALRRQGRRIVCLGLPGHVDPAVRPLCDEYIECSPAKLGRAIRYFRRHRVRTATMAGKMHKIKFFERGFIRRHLPDYLGFVTFFPHFVSGRKDRKDDTLLLTVVGAFARGGVVMVPATDFAPELLVQFGQLSGRSLSKAQQQDIRFGWQLAKEMGRLDVGQSVAVKGRAVLAVEAVEGTDLCIRRAGQLCPAGGFTVVKVAKPQQDMRFDVPTIGISTIQTMAEAGAGVLAIEAGKTIVIDQEEVVAAANRLGIAVVAVDEAAALAGQSAAA